MLLETDSTGTSKSPLKCVILNALEVELKAMEVESLSRRESLRAVNLPFIGQKVMVSRAFITEASFCILNCIFLPRKSIDAPY